MVACTPVVLAVQDYTGDPQEDHSVRPALGKNTRSYLKNNYKHKTAGVWVKW